MAQNNLAAVGEVAAQAEAGRGCIPTRSPACLRWSGLLQLQSLESKRRDVRGSSSLYMHPHVRLAAGCQKSTHALRNDRGGIHKANHIQNAQPGVFVQCWQQSAADAVEWPGYGGGPTSNPWIEAFVLKPAGQLPDLGQHDATPASVAASASRCVAT